MLIIAQSSVNPRKLTSGSTISNTLQTVKQLEATNKSLRELNLYGFMK